MQLIEIKRDQLAQFLADLSRSIETVQATGWLWLPIPCYQPQNIPVALSLLQARALCRAINESLRLTAPKVLDIAIQLNGNTWRIDVSDGSKFEFSYFENV